MKKDREPVIDFVIPWVDGADESWRKQKEQYKATAGDQDISRYRDWDVLRYWFRGIEKYAPWVNKIHFVTCGQCPQWLNTSHDKIHLVFHDEYIPKEFLPTFSSHVIELNMHRIKGLSEQFVYFNDDLFLTAPVRPNDFFKNDLPCDKAIMNAIANTNIENFMPHILMNNMAVINMNFDKLEVLRRDWKKWYSVRYGKDIAKNLLLRPWKFFTGFCNYHMCSPFLKGTLENVWERETELLIQTCNRKFRTKEDVNQYLFSYWQLASGDFVPGGITGAYLTVGQDSAEKIFKVITKQRYQAVCVNDDPFDIDFDYEKQNMVRALETLFPDKSSFEK